jgi:hypothetical protein
MNLGQQVSSWMPCVWPWLGFSREVKTLGFSMYFPVSKPQAKQIQGKNKAQSD